MPLIARAASLWRNLAHRGRVERDLEEELRAAFELLAEEKVRTGMRPEDARRNASLELGGLEAVKEQVREARAGAFADVLLRDVRYAGRLLRRNPLFTLTASLSLAIGIGANTTIFTVANGLLFRPPVGVAAPDRIVDIGRSQNGSGFDNNSYPNFVDARRRATTLEDVYAYRLGAEPMSLAGVGDTAGAERVFGSIVTANYFAVLGVRPAVGRLFGASDSDEPGANPLLVLSHRFWTRRFMNDPSALGRTLQINGHPFTALALRLRGFKAQRSSTPTCGYP